MNSEEQALALIEQIRLEIGHGKLSPQQAEQLRQIAERYPCNREITIWLLVAAYTHKDRLEHLGFAEWPTYFQRALARKDACWSDEDLAYLYQRAAQNYYSDDSEDYSTFLRKARECIQTAVDLAPTDWYILKSYIEIMHAGPDKLPELLERLLSLAPDDVWARFEYARYMNILVIIHGRAEFIEKARWGIAQFLEMAAATGLEATHSKMLVRFRGHLSNLETLSQKNKGST